MTRVNKHVGMLFQIAHHRPVIRRNGQHIDSKMLVRERLLLIEGHAEVVLEVSHAAFVKKTIFGTQIGKALADPAAAGV